MSIVNLFKRITFTALFFISAILSGCNSGTSEEANTTPQTGVVVTEIHITTNSTTLAKNQPSQLKATATYSNGSTADVTNSVIWQSSDNNIASFIGAGVLEGVKSGFVDVTAQFNNITSNTVNIEITSVTLQRLQITPTSIVLAKGLTQPIKVMATYSDSTSSDITAFVSWVFTNTKIATINSAGVVTGVNTGNTKASASYNGVKSNTIDIDVTPAVIKDIKITIRDTDKNGRILSEMKMPLRKGGGKVGSDGSLIKAFYAPGHYRADGWAFFFKPKYGVISGALKTVLTDPTQKVVFHITISGDAVTAKTGNPDTPLQYRIIYYDLDN